MLHKLELISFKMCPFVQRTMVLLNEKNVDVEVTYIDLDNKPDWFNKISPLGQVPILKVDEDSVLFESSVILEFIDEISLPSLQPETPLQKAQNRAWMSYAGDMVMDVSKMARANDENGFQQVFDNHQAKLAKLEANHSGEDFFNSNSFALIDATYAPMFMRLNLLSELCGVEFFADTPKMKKWSAALLSKESVQKSVVPAFPKMFAGMIGHVNGYMATKLK